MLRPRSAALSGLLVLGLMGFTACGSDSDDGDGSATALDSVTVKGDQGSAPDVTFDGALDADEDETVVLAEGSGKKIEDGDTALVHWWIGNGRTKKEANSTFAGAPQAVTLSDQLLPPLQEAISGRTVGTRTAVQTSAGKAFGEEGSPQLGIEAKDSVLFVVDIVGSILDGPQGEDRTPAGWAPELEEKDGQIFGFDFASAHNPGGNLLDTTLVKGDGPEVKKGQTVYVDYLGQVYDAKAPFDQSYERGQPAAFPIGVGQVIKGWDETLVGRTVGSRMIVEIPPNKGYKKKGQPDAGIKGTDTLFFVVDILGAA